MGKYTIASKIIAGGTAAILAWDAHKTGKRFANELPATKIGENLPDIYANSLRSGSTSDVGHNVQKWYVNKRMKTNLFNNFYTVQGYAYGIFRQLRDSVIPLGLAAGALLLKDKKGIGSVACAAGLLLYGLNYLFFDVLQFGRKDYFKKH